MKSETSKTNHKVFSRRKFVAGTAKTLPFVVAATSSKSVWARTMSLSGALSGNLSGRTYYKMPGKHGKKPSFWSKYPDCWPGNCFPGLMVFEEDSNSRFNCCWDWTQSTDYDPYPGQQVYRSWKRNKVSPNVDATAHNGTYATSWNYLGLNWSFLTKETCWESLKYTNESSLECQFAAAFLNASHSGVDYGYSVMELVSLVDKAVRMGSNHVLVKIKDALIDLNERGGVESNLLVQHNNSALFNVRRYNKKNDKWVNNLNKVLGSKDRYPSTFHT